MKNVFLEEFKVKINIYIFLPRCICINFPLLYRPHISWKNKELFFLNKIASKWIRVSHSECGNEPDQPTWLHRQTSPQLQTQTWTFLNLFGHHLSVDLFMIFTFFRFRKQNSSYQPTSLISMNVRTGGRCLIKPFHSLFFVCRPLLYGLVSHFMNSGDDRGRVFLQGGASVKPPPGAPQWILKFEETLVFSSCSEDIAADAFKGFKSPCVKYWMLSFMVLS